MPIPLFQAIPEVVSDYELNPAKGFFSVILPAGRTNKVKNPSLETNSTGYLAVGGTITRSADWQAKGTFSLKVTPGAGVNDGVYYGDSNVLSLTSGEQNWFSFYFKGNGGFKYKAYFATTGGVQLGTAMQFTATGYEQRITLNYVETATNNRRLYIVKDNSTNVQPFYVDALQVEVGDYPTTYLDGSLIGMVPGLTDYYWSGTAHASESIRSAQSADGGRVVNLLDLGFRLMAIVGLGLGGINNILTSLSTGGSIYQKTLYLDRSFSLIGTVTSSGYEQLSMTRQGLISALNSSRTIPQQPVKLLYAPADCKGTDIGRTIEISAVLENGLSAQTDNLNQERLSLDFKLYHPYTALSSTGQGNVLAYQKAITANRMLWRDENGNWFGESLNSSVFIIKPLPDGTWLVGGIFTDAGGDANADRIARFDPSTRTFSAFNATPFSDVADSVLDALVMDSYAIIAGNFINAGGDANADRLAKLDFATGAFSSFNTNVLSAAVENLALMTTGNVAFVGSFTNAGGDANADYIAQLNLTTGLYSSIVTTPPANALHAVVVDKSGTIIIGGSPLNMGGDANADYIAKVVGTTLAALSSSPLTNDVRSIAVGPNGDLFIGGDFANGAGNTKIDAACGFNGTAFYPLGSGLSGSGGSAYRAFVLKNGQVMFSGDFTVAGSLVFADRVGIWTGSAWILPEVNFPGSAIVYTVMEDKNRIAFGFNTAGTAIVSAVTSLSNAGSDTELLNFRIKGPGRLSSLKNFSTGDEIYFDLTLNPGEETNLRIKSDDGMSFLSNLRGNMFGSILPGSDTHFRLQNGANNISVFMTYTAFESGDNGNQLSAFSLQGITPLNSNDGELYISIVNLGGSNRRVDIYQDSARTLLVAQTGTYSTTGSKAVTQANSSGITGTLTVDAVGAADTDISIKVPVISVSWIPTFVSFDGAILPQTL